MMMERLLLVLLTFCTLLQVQYTRGQATQVRKQRNNVTILSRLSNVESMTISIQNELVGIKSMLEVFQKASTEIMGITRRLDEFQKLFERQTELLEERDKQHHLELDTIALETKKLFQRKTRVLENSLKKMERTCTNICSVTTVAPAESTTSPTKSTTSPTKSTTSPTKSTTSPTKSTTSPAKPVILSTRPPTTSPTTHKAKDCWGLKAVYGISEDGVYEVVSLDGRKINVRCDMTTDGGGWTVFQRRGDGSVRFDKTYAEYKSFFGNLSTEFWMGNDFLFEFTRDVKQTLRVDICNWDKETRWAMYRHFSVSSSLDKYRLRVDNYSGTAGDALIKGWKSTDRGLNGSHFSAPDMDNDGSSHLDCASYFNSGWWFNSCFSANLNGVYQDYQPETHSSRTHQGIQWLNWINKHSHKGSEMKIRPSTATPSTDEPFKCPVL